MLFLIAVIHLFSLFPNIPLCEYSLLFPHENLGGFQILLL